MVRCKEASTVLATSQPPRSFGHRLAVQFHLAICPDCRAFRRQIAALTRLAQQSAAALDSELPDDFESALLQHLTDR